MIQYFVLSPQIQWIDESGRSEIGEVLEAAGGMRPGVRAEKGNLENGTIKKALYTRI